MILASLFLSLPLPGGCLPYHRHEHSVIRRASPSPSWSYLRGYKDGWGGIYLGPAHYLTSADYRLGWAKGAKDRKDGKPYNPTGR